MEHGEKLTKIGIKLIEAEGKERWPLFFRRLIWGHKILDATLADDGWRCLLSLLLECFTKHEKWMFSWYVRDEEEWENVNKCQQKSFHNFHSVCHVSGVICSSDFTAITTVMVIVTESWHVTVRRHVFLSSSHQMGQNNQHCFDWTRTLPIKIWENLCLLLAVNGKTMND